MWGPKRKKRLRIKKIFLYSWLLHKRQLYFIYYSEYNEKLIYDIFHLVIKLVVWNICTLCTHVEESVTVALLCRCSSIEPFFRKSHPQFRTSFACSFRLFFRSSPLYLFILSFTDFLYRFCVLSIRFILSVERLSFAHRLSALFIASSNSRKTLNPYACTLSACSFLHRALQCTRMYALYCPAWFITSRSSGPRLRKYGNYNCARDLWWPVQASSSF